MVQYISTCIVAATIIPNERGKNERGKLIFRIFGALAEFERSLIGERTQAGLVAARARGKTGGRPRALTPEQQRIAQALYDDPANSIALE
jgi:DNA invertase Pin-like site-specific DNA recombinase